mmetsp:Transcript_110418/g.291548  ORF Transcript_110418/g.291548 Transcript_110418/m.291548 type:complete len:243 (-) Transcript_110418:431-1159(-)
MPRRLAELGQGQQLRHPGRELHLLLHDQRLPRGRPQGGFPHHHPVLLRRFPILRWQGPRQHRLPRVRRGRDRGRLPRPCGCGAVWSARDPPHRPLLQAAASLAGRHADCEREVLQDARRAAVLLAHDRPLRGAAGGEHRDLEAVPGANGQVQLRPRDGAGHHRRRGGRRGQRRRQPRGFVFEAGGDLAGVRGALRGARWRVHRGSRVRQRARRLLAWQREVGSRDFGQGPDVHFGEAGRQGR